MKKKRIILFPGSENTATTKQNNSAKPLLDIQVGKVYKIGQPSNRYYQYIHPVIKPGTLNLNDLEDFKKIKNHIVSVTSILRMSNGNRIAVLRSHKGEIFPGKVQKIFAHISMAVKSEEVVHLDSNSRLNLDSNGI